MFQPGCSITALKERAQLLQALRAFFASEGVLEVDVPVLGLNTVTDPYIESLHCDVAGESRHLQTSPEFFMKRLLAAGAPSMYYLGKAFRRDEAGVRHRAEFTMAEWYLLGADERQLMQQLTRLLRQLAPALAVNQVSYGDLFEKVLGVCPYRASSAELQPLAQQNTGFEGALVNKSAWLDLLFSHCVEPTLSDGFTLVSDYPAEQAALARIAPNSAGQPVARRFELFGNGIELANGYWELTDPQVQRERFAADRALRQQMGLADVAVDERFLQALDAGLPECAGVALGVDRLLMVLLGESDIARVTPFANA